MTIWGDVRRPGVYEVALGTPLRRVIEEHAVGTASLARILRAIESGGSRPRDLRDLREVSGFMSGHGYCAHCRVAAAVASAMARGFGEAVDAHVSGGSCPWPECRHPDPFAPASPERAAVEAAVQEQLR